MTREEMIIEYYENGKIPLIIRLIDEWKGRKNEHRNNRTMDTKRTNTIYDNGDNTSWYSTKFKKINNEEIK